MAQPNYNGTQDNSGQGRPIQGIASFILGIAALPLAVGGALMSVTLFAMLILAGTTFGGNVPPCWLIVVVLAIGPGFAALGYRQGTAGLRTEGYSRILAILGLVLNGLALAASIVIALVGLFLFLSGSLV